MVVLSKYTYTFTEHVKLQSNIVNRFHHYILRNKDLCQINYQWASIYSMCSYESNLFLYLFVILLNTKC